MFSRTGGIATLVLGLTIALGACDGGTDTEFGSVSLLLTDANDSGISEAWVTFTDIYLQGSGGDEDPMGGREYLLQDGFEEFELTRLAGEVATLVEGQTIPAGSYGQLRVVLQDACIVTPEGIFATPGYSRCEDENPEEELVGVVNLTSAGTSGWKVQLNGLQVDGDQEIILLDFLVDQSFFMETAGPANRYNLYPVIKGAEVSITGGFDVTLADPEGLLPEGRALTEFSVTMEPSEGDAEEESFREADEGYLADFEFERPGLTYTLILNAPSDLTVTVAPASPASRDLASGETLDIEWVITDVVAGGAS